MSAVIPSMAGLSALAPLAFACVWAMVVLASEMFSADRRFVGIGWLSLVGLAVLAAYASVSPQSQSAFAGVVAFDGFSAFFTVLVAVLAGTAVMMSIDFLPMAGIRSGEYYPLMLFAVAGVMIMAAAADLIVLFLGLEIMSMAVYVLAGVRKHDKRSNEAALKYFLLGAFASSFLVYGMALVYGYAGTTHFGGIASALSSGEADLLFYFGVALILVGLGFKVAAVPFHMWTPDVYEGSPSSVTVFMATVVKAGGFAAVVKVLMIAMAAASEEIRGVLWVSAAVTMTAGNLIALRQTSLKRMLAYSSIAHTGYLLVGVCAATTEAASSILFYLVVYGAMNLGAFGVMMLMVRDGEPAERIDDLAGLGQRRPMLALAMTLCMLSLTGIPPLGGFMAKLYLFSAAVRAGEVALVVVAAVNSVISAAYYLGVVRCMYFDTGGLEPQSGRPYITVALAASVAVTVLTGLVPAGLLGAASRAMANIALGP